MREYELPEHLRRERCGHLGRGRVHTGSELDKQNVPFPFVSKRPFYCENGGGNLERFLAPSV